VSAISLRAVSVVLGGSRVVDRVDADVERGEWLTLIGPNGAGKSTLLRAIAGLVGYEGTIELDGLPSRRLGRREIAKRLAFVPQSPLLPPDLAVRDYVLLGRTPYIGSFGTESASDLAAADRALARLDLVELASRPLRTLSGGEQQRAVLARAFAQEAPLLVLDEPTTALDIGRQQQVLELVASLREEHQTVVSAMHELTLASQYGDRLLLLSRGRVVAGGVPAEIATERLIEEHYGASVRVVVDEEGEPVGVIPLRRPRP
jgi:iron complex transport system ATP-binding protein